MTQEEIIKENVNPDVKLFMREAINLKVFMSDGMKLPEYSRDGDAAIDLCASKDVTIKAHSHALVPTGFHIEIPNGYVGLLFPRSGNALKTGIGLRNSVGVIDSNYRGDVGAILDNTTKEDFAVTRGMRIAQFMLVPIPRMNLIHYTENEFEKLHTNRGANGFGSSGK